MRRVRWSKAWRIIASRYPPIDVFERVARGNRAISDALIALEEATNPRVRDEVGEIRLVPEEERVSGPGASYVMAPFTHINPKGSRFSDGSYGVYYAAAALETAIAETIHHFEAFARDADDPPRGEDMRVLVGRIDAELDDIEEEPAEVRARLLDPDSYAHSQPWGRARREAGSRGVVFPSVRHEGGTCIGAFSPRVPGIPVQERHLHYAWDGTRVRKYFDYLEDRWVEWPVGI
jgi:hypothetical protein